MSNKPIQVNSEIGKLKKVVLHRPGKELENLMPDYLERLLFDDIPFLEEAQREHDRFAEVLRENGAEVLYLEQLVTEALEHADVKEQFVDEWISEAGIDSENIQKLVKEHLLSLDTFDMVLKTMEGFKKNEIKSDSQDSLADLMESDYPFLVDPMPNLYFTRDPFATMGNGVTVNHMYADTRNRETLYGHYIFTYHPEYGGDKVERFYNRDEDTRIEGGDELVLSKDCLAVGISQRTDSRSIEKLARRVFETGEFKEVLAFLIGEHRKFMHLDTVFTMIDHDKFTIHPEIEAGLRVVSLTPGEDGSVNIEEKDSNKLDEVLADALGIDKVTLIPCAGGDIVGAAREQWNDGSNTLAIAPGEVVVYERNTITNKLLEEAGITLHKIKGSELVRGRGGPRCMSMPLYREDI
ncbi:MAG TPA: arginine deiminase [Alloiococcus sp.]|nr:arginine deiminase [Alloiococcus sp.]